MTKESELNLLCKTASELGSASYLGTWLLSIVDELERDLRSDFIPVLTLAEARKRADAILCEAQAAAERTRQKAQVNADATLQKAIDSARAIRESILSDVQRALKSLA